MPNPTRGRPRRVQIEPTQGAPVAIESAAAEPVAGAVPVKERRRRPNTGGHRLKLAASGKVGETRRWSNDDGDTIARRQELGYEFVSDTGVKTDQPGSRIARRVGTQEDGSPLYAYLMETPDQLYQQGLDEREREDAKVDAAIQAGRDVTGRLSSTESYGQGSIKIDR